MDAAGFDTPLPLLPRVEWSLVVGLLTVMVGTVLHWLPLTVGLLPLFGMVQVGVGNAPNDGLGDTRRVGMQKVNQYAFLNDYTVSAQAKVFAGGTNEISISNAVAACVTNGWTGVWIGGSWLPYAAENVTFNASVHMYAEGHADDGVYDVEAYGGDPRGYASTMTSTVAAINACHSAIPTSGPVGGTIFFGPGNFAINSSITITKHNVRIQGSGGWTPGAALFTQTMLSNTTINAAMVIVSGAVANFQCFDMGFYGPGVAFTSSKGMTINDAAGDFWLERLYFNGYGLHALQTGGTTATVGGTIIGCMAENSLLALPGTDQGAFDINSSDCRMISCFATPSVSSGAGNLGTGHCFGFAIRGANGFYDSCMAELAHRGWLVSSTTGINRFVKCRSFLTQAEGWVISSSSGNTFTACHAISCSQDTDNTYAGFNVTGGGNVFGDCFVDGLGGDARQAKYGFLESNSVGTNDANTTANQYSNNRVGPSVRGQLYFQNGTNAARFDHPHRVSPDRGDAASSFTPFVDAETVMYQTALTAARTCTINGSSLGYPKGTRCMVVRTAAATGLFALSVVATGGDTVLLGAGRWVMFEIDNGFIWRAVASGSTTGVDTAVALVSGTTPALNAALGTYFTLSVLTNIAAVIAVPTNAPAAGQSKRIRIAMRNGSGGVLTTAPTFNTGAGGFKFSAVTNPANGLQVLYTFDWDPVQSFWYEVSTHLAAGL